MATRFSLNKDCYCGQNGSIQPLILLVNWGDELLCRDLLQGLRERGHPVQVLQHFCDHDANLAWRVDTARSSSSFRLKGGANISSDAISGVFVRRRLFSGTAGSTNEDAGYLYAEEEAALLGWLWSLRCPVINRYTPELWFAPSDSLNYWHGRLEQFGLQAEESPGMDEGRSYPVSVIGPKAIWDEAVPQRLRSLDQALIRFAASLGLSYIEYRITALLDRPRVAAVNPFPRYDVFCVKTRNEIVGDLIGCVKPSGSAPRVLSESDSWF